MKKMILLFLIIISSSVIMAQSQYTLPYDTTRFKGGVIKLGPAYDVVLYRDSSDILKTINKFEAKSYRVGDVEVISADRKLKNVTLDSTVIMDSTFYYSIIHASDSVLDNMNDRLIVAEGNISSYAGEILDINGDIAGIQSGLLLKANITTTDSLRGRVSSAEAGIILNANNINGINSSLTLYAKKDSLMSYIEITPDMISINGDVTFAPGYDPSQKTDSSKVVTIIDGRVTAAYVNAMTIIADSIAASKYISSPIITGGTISGTTIKTSDGPYNIVIGNDEIEMAQGNVHITAAGQMLNLDASDVVVSADFKANNYFSGDNTQGATTTVSGLVFKDGLYTSGSITGTAGGTVTNVAIAGGTGLTTSGGPITDYGTITVSAASGYAIPTSTQISNWNAAHGWGNHASAGYQAAFTPNAPLSWSGSNLVMSAATASSNGYLTSTDWNTFNNKLSSSALTGYATQTWVNTNYASAQEMSNAQQDIGDIYQTLAGMGSYVTAAQVNSLIASYFSSHTSTIQYIDWGINEASMNVIVP